LRQLTHPVGPEVEEDRRVLRRVEPRPFAQDDRLDELVGDAAVVARPHRRDGVVCPLALTRDDRLERAIGPFPALVAIHGVVAPGHGRDAIGGQRREVVDSGVRRDVAAVGEGVDPRAVVHSRAPRQVEQCPQVVDVRVHAAGRHEAEQVDVRAALLRPPERAEERLVLEERPVVDRLADADEVL
jgi:hypothetical protein